MTNEDAAGGELRLIVDTNVFQEFTSLSDLLRATALPMTEDEILQSREVAYRKSRTRDSVMLAWFCHRHRVTTYGVTGEKFSILLRLAPPELREDPNTAFVQAIIHFVTGSVLRDWVGVIKFPDEPDELEGNAADDWLLSKAIGERLPLITNEGNSINGLSGRSKGKANLRGRARAEGAAVFTPGEFLEMNHFDFEGEGRAFLRSFDDAVPGYLDGREDREAAEETLGYLRGLYAYVFFDELKKEFQNRPRVTWPPPVTSK
jgi:hypothetical protein